MQMYPVATLPHVPACAPPRPSPPQKQHQQRRGSAQKAASSSPSRSRDRDGLSSTSPADPSPPENRPELSAEARPAKDELPRGLPLQKVKREEPEAALEEGRQSPSLQRSLPAPRQRLQLRRRPLQRRLPRSLLRSCRPEHLRSQPVWAREA